MQTEDFFSVYGAGYVQQRQEGMRIFSRGMPRQVRLAAVGISVSLLLATALTGAAQHVIGTALAGATYASGQK
jgi:hypothetical protein